MKQTRFLMGMHITVEVVDRHLNTQAIDDVYDYFASIDHTFSTYKPKSEISQINAGVIDADHYSLDMKQVLSLCQQTTRETNGFFNISHDGILDPSGLVKGWAIHHAAQLLQKRGAKNFYVDAGGDVQAMGHNAQGKPWVVGIKNPFHQEQIVKVVAIHNQGIATSGSYIRGQHVYNPLHPEASLTEIVSMSVIGPNVYEADRFATAAFAMQAQGIYFIEQLAGFEGYMIDQTGRATFTSHFSDYCLDTQDSALETNRP